MNIYTIFEASEDICKQGLRVQKFRISANISYFVWQYRCWHCRTLACVSPEYTAWLCVSPTQFLLHVEICFYLHTTTSHHQPPASLLTHRGQGLHCSSPGIMSTDFTSHDRHTPGRCHAPCHDDESPRVTNVSIPHLIVLHICTLYSAALYTTAVLYSAAAHDWHWHCFVLSRVFLDAISISGGVAVRALRNISSFNILS